ARGVRLGAERAIDLLRVPPRADERQVVPGAHLPGLLPRRKLRARPDADRQLQALPQPRRLQPQSDRAQGPRRASRSQPAGAGRACVRAVHPVQNDDAQCTVCHTSDGTGIADVTLKHEITQRTRTRGLTISNAAISSAATPVVTFALTDAAGNVVSDLIANKS